MIKQITFCPQHNRFIKYPWTGIEFAPGYNVVIGQVGSGKTLLLTAIKNCANCEVESSGKIFHFSTEYNDIRSVAMKTKQGEVLNRLSHGEGTSLLFQANLKALALKGGDTLLIDEPEAGLDVGCAHEVAAALTWLTDKDIQVIVATHNPIFVMSCQDTTDRVTLLSVEAREPKEDLDIFITEWEAAAEALREWFEEHTAEEEEEEEEEKKDAESAVTNTNAASSE